MNNSLSISWQWLTTDLRRLAVLISLLFSVWIILTHDTMAIDGARYLDAAHLIVLGDWTQAYALTQWLFFPAIIAFISKLTFLDVYASGLLINTLLFASLPWLFISILKTMGANRSTLIAGLIIISVVPYLNEYRADILRGVGSWVGFLWALLMLIRFQQSSRLSDAIWWGVACSVGVLFRIEIIAYLALMPLGLYFHKTNSLTKRIKSILICYSFPLSLAVALTPFIILNIIPPGRLLDPFIELEKFWSSLLEKIPAKAVIINENILNPLSGDFGTSGVFSILLTILIVTLVKRTTILVSALAIYALLNKYVRQSIMHLPLLLWMMAINLLYLTVFLTHSFFLTGRIAMPLGLSAALIASYPLGDFLQKPFRQLNSVRQKSVRGLIIFLLIFMTLDGLISFGASKAYIRDSGTWLQQTMKAEEVLISNHNLIKHYAGRRENLHDRKTSLKLEVMLSNKQLDWKLLDQADYLALYVKNLDPAVVAEIEQHYGVKPVKYFGDNKIFIYQYQPSHAINK